jgi:phosphatidate cytidylyltransferase
VLKSRIITAVILLLLLLAVMFALPDIWWTGVVVLVVMQGTLEWTKLSKISGWGAYVYGILTLLMMLALVWFDSGHADDEQAIVHLAVYSASAVLWLLIVPAWMKGGWRVENPLLMCMTGWAVLIPTGLAMMDLHTMSPLILLLVMCLVWVADIGAYFSGRRFGKHKLAASISPGKTWEGVAGAVLGVSLYVVVIWSYSPYQFHHLPILLFVSWFWIVLAVMGDLFESAIKRQAGVKDSGALLPGHGGLLDRIDALTPTLPLAAMMLLFWQIN